MLKAIEAKPEPATIDLGFMLLTLSEDTVVKVSAGIQQIAKQAVGEGKNHDLTVGLGRGHTGLTIHCNDNPIEIAGQSLQKHCHARKYTERAQTWFGVCIRPSDQSLRFGLNLDFPWDQSDAMDALTKTMGKFRSVSPPTAKELLRLLPFELNLTPANGTREAGKKKHDKVRAKAQRRNRRRK